jgi:hypothetical protein
VRWYQVAAFYPFMRGHAHLEAKRREPWLFGEENTARMRAAIRQRWVGCWVLAGWLAGWLIGWGGRGRGRGRVAPEDVTGGAME